MCQFSFSNLVSIGGAQNVYSSEQQLPFRSDDTIVLRIENNTRNSIYLRQALDPSRLIREEGLQIERAVGSGFVPVLPFGRRPDETTTTDNGAGAETRITSDHALTALFALRSTMNITRRWSVLSPNAPALTAYHLFTTTAAIHGHRRKRFIRPRSNFSS